MYEFHRVGESTCYLSAPTNIGIYLRGKGAYLIDAGSRDADADQILRVLGENGLTLAGVISTHAHADHTGGNRRLQDVTGCPVFASPAEGAIIANPILNTSLLYGSYPPEELRRIHYLYAGGCRVGGFEHPAFPKELEILPLPGHSVGMVAVRTPDGVLFAADAVVDENAWKKAARRTFTGSDRRWNRWTGWNTCPQSCTFPRTQRPRRTSPSSRALTGSGFLRRATVCLT